MTKKMIWIEHADDMIRAARVMERMTKQLNVDHGVSDLEFMVPTRVEIKCAGAPTEYGLELEDGVWYITVENDK